MRKLINLLTTAFFSLNSFSQINTPSPTVPSANLGKINMEVGGDLFNGRLNVSIPLYNYDLDGVSVPITLAYNGGNGIKPDELPGWVGMGWNLQTGGFIHRTVRGKADEALDFETIITTVTAPPHYITSTQQETKLHTTDYSYFSNTSKLNVTNWETSTYASSFYTSLPNNPYTGPYGAFGTQTIMNHYPKFDLVPDEFTFSMGGISGKFYLNHLNHWIVESSDGRSYTINVYTGEQTIVNIPWSHEGSSGVILKKVPRMIKYITLTSTDGIKYYFGNSDMNAPYQQQYFEYSRSSTLLPPTGTLSLGPMSGGEYLDIVPHTWHLTKIENLRTGSAITFNYKQQGLQFYKTKQAWASGGTQTTGGQVVYSNTQYSYTDPDNQNSIYRLSAISKVLTRNWTLIGISFPNGVQIDFISTPSTQLSTSESLNISDWATFDEYEDIWNYPGYRSSNGLTNMLLKLDKIVVKYNADTKKEINFTYSNSNSQRLQLTSVKESGSNSSEVSEYKFGYNNSVPLPGYGSAKTDHWGYFNNQDFFSSPPTNNWGYLSTYASSREPNAGYGEAEILNKITYPTGGWVEFEYQGHTYSKRREATDFSITNLGSTNNAGGVRIRKIRYYHLGSVLSGEKEFDYSDPASGTVSSGVLSAPAPGYLFGSASFYYFRAAGFNSTDYDGNHVTYTYVTEKEVGNGSTQYEYTNYDNGYNDGSAIGTDATGIHAFEYGYSRKLFKRGKPKTITILNAAGAPIKKKTLKYDHDNSESAKEEIRSLYLDRTINSYAAVVDKIYTDHLLSTEELTYSTSGNLLQTQTINYDQYGNVVQTTTDDSKGQVIREKFKYCYDYSSLGSDNISLGIKNLNDNGIKNALVEKISYRENPDGSNSKVFAASLNTYKTYSMLPDKVYQLQISAPVSPSSFVESASSSGGFIKDSRYTTEEAQYGNYDQRQNLLQLNSRNNIKTSFQWDYNQNYQTVKIVNAENSKHTSVLTVPGIATGNFSWAPNSSSQQTAVFEQTYSGSISISVNWGGYPGSATVNMSYFLSGPSSESGSVCTSTAGGCSNPQTIVFNNKPAGQYTLSVYINGSFSASVTGSYTYQSNVPQQITEGKKEFYYEGFEETGTATANPYAGKKYYAGDYPVPYQPEGLKNYKINYHYLESGVWKNKTVSYSYPVTLSDGDAIDEVRIFPSDALMSTYTYDPLIGITSETDPNGKSMFYEYDALNRLKLIRDNDRNIVKQYEYKFQDEPCGVDWQNTTTAIRCKQVNGVNTGEQEQEQRDVNPCSQTYNSTRWIVVSTNTSICPLPQVYAKISLESPDYGYGYTTADIVVRFYSDQAGTTPLSVNNLMVYYGLYHYTNDVNDGTTYFQQACSGSVVVLQSGANIHFEDFNSEYSTWQDWVYFMQPGSYTIIY